MYILVTNEPIVSGIDEGYEFADDSEYMEANKDN